MKRSSWRALASATMALMSAPSFVFPTIGQTQQQPILLCANTDTAPDPSRAIADSDRATRLAQVNRDLRAPRAVAEVAQWQTQLVGHIERFKRYPEESRSRGENGLAMVAFTIDRDGRLLSSRIEQSSGSSILDEESLAMLVRADPMPRPPDQIAVRDLSFVLPIRFAMGRPPGDREPVPPPVDQGLGLGGTSSTLPAR